MTESRQENPYSLVPEDFSNAAQRTNFSAYESRVLWFIVRKTFGFQKAMDRISFSQFEEATNIARVHIHRTLNHLVKRNIILCMGFGYKLEYGIQTDYTQWSESLPKEVTKGQEGHGFTRQPRLLPDEVTINPPDGVPDEVTISLPKEVTNGEGNRNLNSGTSLPQQDAPVPKEVTKSLPQEVNTKEEVTKTKEITKKAVLQTFDQYVEVLRLRFNDLPFDEEVEKFKLWWSEGRREMKRPKLALFNWMTKARRLKEEAHVTGSSAVRSARPDGSHQRPTPKAQPSTEEYERDAENYRKSQGAEG